MKFSKFKLHLFIVIRCHRDQTTMPKLMQTLKTIMIHDDYDYHYRNCAYRQSDYCDQSYYHHHESTKQQFEHRT